MDKFTIVAVVVMFSIFFSHDSYANSRTNKENDWSFILTPYVWGAGLDGTVSINDFPPRNIKLDTNDIINNLDLVFMSEFEAKRNNVGICLDYIYLNLSDSTSSSQIRFINDASLEIKQTIVTASLFYRFKDSKYVQADFFSGLRYNDIKQNFAVSLNNNKYIYKNTENWLDPIIGLRFVYQFTDKLYTKNSMDIGGFDVGSRLTSQFSSTIGYKFNDHIQSAIGYRFLKTEYNSDYFKYDVVLDGFILNVSYLF